MCRLRYKYKFKGLIYLEDNELDRDINTLASSVNSNKDKAKAKLDKVNSLLLPSPKVLCRSKALS